MSIQRFTKAIVAFVVIGGFVIGCSQIGPKVWVEQSDELTFDASGLSKIAITTHNGRINVNGNTDRNDVQVMVTRKGGGKNEESAAAALEAIEIVSESSGDGTHKLGYRWKTEKRFDWQEQVSFEVAMPARLIVNANSHNGAIDVNDVAGDCDLLTHNGAVTATNVRAACRIETHNGRVVVDAPEATVSAVTHNGAISAKCGGDSVQLSSHNGGITLDAASATALNGGVTTHNGAVKVMVPIDVNAELTCRTNNGSIKCDAPWKDVKVSKRVASGVLGDGSGRFKVETSNGSIRIQEAQQ